MNIFKRIKHKISHLKLAPITFLVQDGTSEIDSEGCFRIDTAMCHLQAKYSLNRQRFHPLTKGLVGKFLCGNKGSNWYVPNTNCKDYGKPSISVVDNILSDKNLSIELYLTIIGLCETMLWTIDTMHKKQKYVPFYLYHIENGLHPKHQSSLTDMLYIIHKYAELTEIGVKENFDYSYINLKLNPDYLKNK